MRLLLINPKYPETFWSFQWVFDVVLPGKLALNPPLGLTTIAALCPSHWEVEIVDESIEALPMCPNVDLIGVGGMSIQFPRQSEILEHYRKSGYYVVAGGPYASLCPELYAQTSDTVVVGEAEYVWPEFCDDFESGRPKRLYCEEGTVNLEDSPTPRFDLIPIDKYTNPTIQFSRGCPYRCEFCDIIVMYGRKPRTKTPEQIGRELDLLVKLDAQNISFVDDNLIGHRPQVKKLLKFLATYQREHATPLRFGSQLTINVAEDDELLDLLHAANFHWVFIGIESPDEASLLETKKVQNLRSDMLSSVRRIYSRGLDVTAGFVIGFDNDTIETFERQQQFITASGIQVAMVGLLMAVPRTPLYARLAREGRLRADHAPHDTSEGTSNIVPKQMSHESMVSEYRALYHRLFSDSGIYERIRNKCEYLRRSVGHGEYSTAEAFRILIRLVVRGVLPGGPRRWYWFVRTFLDVPRVDWSIVVSDWISGLAIRSYAERHHQSDKSDQTIKREPAERHIRTPLASSASPQSMMDQIFHK